MLPVCPITLLNDMWVKDRNIQGAWGFSGSFFTEVGTTVHAVLEEWVGISGHRPWGDWICNNHDKPVKWQHTDDSTCPGCGGQGKYEEVTVEYLGFKGHIDIILITDDGILVGDYKTSTANKLAYPTYSKHNPAYPLQLMVYTYLLHKLFGKHFMEKYGLKIMGCSLLFISRDNPFRSREFHWDAEHAIKFGRQIAHINLHKFNAAKRAYKANDITLAIKRRVCVNAKDYEKRVKAFHPFGGCPLASKCFKTKEITQHLNQLKP